MFTPTLRCECAQPASDRLMRKWCIGTFIFRTKTFQLRNLSWVIRKKKLKKKKLSVIKLNKFGGGEVEKTGLGTFNAYFYVSANMVWLSLSVQRSTQYPHIRLMIFPFSFFFHLNYP